MDCGRPIKRLFGALMLVIFLCALVHLSLCPDEDCPVCPAIRIIFTGLAAVLLPRRTAGGNAVSRASKADARPTPAHSFTLLSQHTYLKS